MKTSNLSLFYTLLLMSFFVKSFGQKVQLEKSISLETGLDKAVAQFLSGLQQQDFNKINALIHPKYGLHLQYTIGSSFGILKIDSLEPTDNIYLSKVFSAYQFPHLINYKYEPLPKINCDLSIWEKTGNFYYKQSQYLKKQYQLLNESYQVYTPEELASIINNISSFDNTYIGIFILDPKSENDVIVYFKNENGKWYLIIWDLRFFCDA